MSSTCLAKEVLACVLCGWSHWFKLRDEILVRQCASVECLKHVPVPSSWHHFSFAVKLRVAGTRKELCLSKMLHSDDGFEIVVLTVKVYDPQGAMTFLGTVQEIVSDDIFFMSAKRFYGKKELCALEEWIVHKGSRTAHFTDSFFPHSVAQPGSLGMTARPPSFKSILTKNLSVQR